MGRGRGQGPVTLVRHLGETPHEARVGRVRRIGSCSGARVVTCMSAGGGHMTVRRPLEVAGYFRFFSKNSVKPFEICFRSWAADGVRFLRVYPSSRMLAGALQASAICTVF